jgi:hypothetical protein
MAERQKRVNELDPNPGQGDVEFKKAVLGAAAVLSELNSDSSQVQIDDDLGRGDFVVSDGSKRSGAAIAEGSVGNFDGLSIIDTELRVPQGTYAASYVEIEGGQDHYLGRTDSFSQTAEQSARRVPIEHLPKHERKMETGSAHDARTRNRHEKATGPRVYVEGLDVPKHIPEEHRPGYIDAVRGRAYRHRTDAKRLRGQYTPTLRGDTKHGQRAAKIINHQVAKRLKKHAADLREKKIADLKSIDLGDDDI